MAALSLALIALGVLLMAHGARRARGPYRRYMALREQDANIARYEAWRGGVRSNDTTGASVAMAMLRRQAQIGVGIAILGALAIAAGLVVR